MRLTLTRSGGFAGLVRPPVTHDTAELPPASRAEVEKLVARARFFELPATLTVGAPQPDRFQHSLTIAADDGRQHTVSFSEEAASEELSRLVTTLQTLKK